MSQQAVQKEALEAAFGRDYFAIDPTRCALLIIDMQNGFVAEGGVFEAPPARAIVPTIDRLVEYARGHGIPVIWVLADHSPPGGGLVLDRFPILGRTTELRRGDPSFELYPALIQPRDDEYRVVKHKYDAFRDTDLDTVLRNLGKDTVIVTGATTECCCESSARSAFEHDYKVVFLRDATATTIPEQHDQACDRIDVLVGRVLGTDELLEILEAGGEGSADLNARLATSLEA